jgi:hypothetical protein
MPATEYDSRSSDLELYTRQLFTLMRELHLDLKDAQRVMEGRRPLTELLARVQ